MNYRIISRILGYAMLTEAAMLLLSMGVGLYYGEAVKGFLITIGLLSALGMGLIAVKPDGRDMYAREGFVTVALSWAVFSAFGALPFYIDGAIPNYIDALFEAVSGFTTTGASILTDVEALPKGLMFWRSFTHWVGGMGVLVFMMAVLPLADNRNMHIMRAEVPGPVVGKLVPKTRETALILYGIYVAMTALEVVLLLIGGMPFYDALLHSFATAGTGGFGIKNTSIAYYESAYIEIVISIFMLLFSINFSLYFLILLRNLRPVYKNEELRVFALVVTAAVLAIAIDIGHMYEGVGQSLRYSLFQVATVISTTGFSTADFNQWPEFSKGILVVLMLVGACAGSTGGGIKMSRIIILFKSVICEMHRMMHPRSVNPVKLDGKSVSDEVSRNTQVFFILYVFIMVASMLAIAGLDQFDFTTTVTGVVACIGNIGPGLSMVGPVGNFSAFCGVSKLILILNMLLGRLELFPIIMMFAPSTWKKV